MPDYDFTTVADRTAMGSTKWAAMRRANPNVGDDVVPFSVADLDIKTAPEITTGLQAYLQDAVLGYNHPPDSYFDALTGWMQRRHQWTVERDWVVLTSGVVTAFFNAVRAYTSPGDGVILQTPAYYPFYAAIERNERTLLRNPLVLRDGHFEIDFDQLNTLAQQPKAKLLLLCSPHNPTGRVWTRDELQRVADIAMANDLIVVSDEIHFDLVMPGHRHVVFSTLSDTIAARTVVCTAPSKTFNLAGMTTSNIVIADRVLRQRFIDEMQAGSLQAGNVLGHKACELAYTQAEAWLDALLELIAHNHHLVRETLAETLPQVTVFDLEGTYLQWLDCRALGLSASELKHRHQQQAQVFFNEGPIFGPEGAGFERMNLATPTAVVEAALARLAQCHNA